ncbi:MAG: dihydroorotase [bacterium]
MKKLLIKGGRLVDPAENIDGEYDLLIIDGKVAEVGSDLSEPTAETIDASGKLVTPGLIDMHVHLRDPGFEDKEDIASGTRSAAAGGFTSVACMPNTAPVIDNAAVVTYIKTKAQKEGWVNVFPIGAITKGLKGEEISEVGYLYKSGAVALSDDGKPVMNSEVMRRSLEYSKMFDLAVIAHSEDSNLAADGMMNEGYMATVLGLKGIPNAAESAMIARDIELAKLTGGRLHIAHVSARESVDLIRNAKKQGVKITAEAAPHHFTLTDEAVAGFDTSTKVNPPLRTAEDVEAIKSGLKDGTIDAIATDHAPHTEEEKAVEYLYAPCGMIGLETAFALAYTELVQKNILSLPEMIAKFTVNPARILNLKGKGSLKAGQDADIAIFDLAEKWVVDRNKMYSKAKNTPFHGFALQGKPVITIVNGEIVNFK